MSWSYYQIDWANYWNKTNMRYVYFGLLNGLSYGLKLAVTVSINLRDVVKVVKSELI